MAGSRLAVSRTYGIAALAVLSLALLVWAVSLRRANERLSYELRSGHGGRGTAAVPRGPDTDQPDELKAENQRLRRELEEAARPQFNLPALALPVLGRGSPPPLAAGSGALLVLRPPASAVRPEYRLRVLAHDGSIVWEGSGLRRAPDGAITVVWPAPLARPGEYRLELFGPAQVDPRLEAFPLTVKE
jgi:hypothetical protein